MWELGMGEPSETSIGFVTLMVGMAVGQFACHPEQAFFARRWIWASRAKCRVLCDTIIARLARFFIKLSHYVGMVVIEFGGIMSKVSIRVCTSTRMFAMIVTMLAGTLACQARSAVPVPAPVLDEAKAAAPTKETTVISGGCFWGIQAVFQHVKGVISATSGYSGGSAKTAEYEVVSTGETGHAESVKIVYDPSKITYGQLLRVSFSVAHDPPQLNRQAPDEGTQYRSSIFYGNDEQRKIAEAYIAQLEQAKVFPRRI